MQATKLKTIKDHSLLRKARRRIPTNRRKDDFDTLDAYADSGGMRQSLERALKDVRHGRLHTTL